MAVGLRSFFLVLVGLAASGAIAKPVDLSELSPDTQKGLLKACPGLRPDGFTPSDLDCAVRFLISQDQFDSAKFSVTEAGGVRLTVGKARRVHQIVFKGNSAFTEAELHKEFAIADRAPFDPQTLSEAGERVRQLYIEHAYLNAVVDLEFKAVSNIEMDVTANIRENSRTTIQGVAIVCDNPELKAKLQKRLSRQLGDPFTEETVRGLRASAAEYLNENKYLKSDLKGPQVDYSKDDTKVSLNFTIERSDRYEIAYKGLATYSEKTIRNEMDLSHFTSSNPNVSQELAARVKAFYVKNGFARVQVQGEEVPTDVPFNRKIILEVTENPKIKLKEVIFSGRMSLDPSDYRKRLLADLSPVTKDGYYVKDDIDRGLKNLTRMRQNDGYFQTKIISVRSTYNPEKTQISVFVSIDEGPLTTVSEINIKGTHESADDIRAVLELKTGEPLHLNQLEKSIVQIKDYYHDRGYLEMTIKNESQSENENLVTYSDDATLAKVNFDVYEGPQIYVGGILLEGNTITQDFVITKELEFRVGDLLTPQKIAESIRRLQLLGHFLSVDIQMQEAQTQVSRRTIVVKVQERIPGLFNGGVGVTNERELTLRGFTGVAYRNILGTGRAASARLELNYNPIQIPFLERKASFGYSEPYIFDTRTRGKVNYVYSDLINPENNLLAINTSQIIFTAEQNLTSNILLSFDVFNNAVYRSYNISNHQDTPATLGQSPVVDIASIGPRVDVDLRDNPFNPTRGSLTTINLQYGGQSLGSSRTVDYASGSGSFSYYTPLTKSGSWVWANSVRGAILKNLCQGDPNCGVPYDKKGLTVGGDTTVRGFSPSETFPNLNDFNYSVCRNPNYKISPSYINLPPGAATPLQSFCLNLNQALPPMSTIADMFLFKSELRFPISGNIGAAFFYDGGAVFIQNMPFEFPYHHAIGVSLRYVTPVGAISFFYGYKLNPVRQVIGSTPFRQDNLSYTGFSIGSF